MNETRRISRIAALLGVVLATPVVHAQSDERIRNWDAPPFWREPAAGAAGRTALAAGPTALPFVALFPCRLVDTRGNAPLTGGFLPPATVRSYTLAGVCNVPANAKAISLNVVVVHPTGPGFITLYPEGGTFPPVSTLNYLGGDVIVNAAVVPLSATGGISMALGVSGGDVVLDTNGYYTDVPSVTSLNTLSGDVTLAPGTNVTITPLGKVLTIAAAPGSGGPPTGAAGGSLSGTYPNPGIADGAVTDAKIASVAFGKVTGMPAFVSKAGDTMTGSLTLSGGNVVLGVDPSSGAGGSIVKGGKPFLHDTGFASNTFVGLDTGSFVVPGGLGDANTGVGWGALRNDTQGRQNTAVGLTALYSNTTGGSNVAVGVGALSNNTTGLQNTAVGAVTLGANTTGGRNVAIGYLAGESLGNGNFNVVISNPGDPADSGVIRIGLGGFQTRAFVSGIRGVATGVADGLPVFVDSNGQLGTSGGTVTAASFTGPLAGDVTGTQPATVVATVGGQTAANVAAGAAAANAAASANTASAIVKRDAAGNFAAGTVTAALLGAASANVLKTGDSMSGNLNLGAGLFLSDAVVYKTGNRFIHTTGGLTNVFVGINSANLTTTGSNNSAFGYAAFLQNGTGSSNSALGVAALFYNTSGSQNTAAGHSAGSRTDPGTGYSGSGINFVANTTGNFNTFLGYGTGATTDVSNCTAVGIDAYCDGSDQVRLGNYFVNSIGGKVAWSALSDARAKENVRDLDRGLDLVLNLRPVSYRLKGGNGRTDMGFVAQDVEALLGQGFNVVDAGGDADRTLSLRYTDLIAPLVKAVQEQQATIEADRREIEDLKARLARLEEALERRATRN